MRRAFRFVSLYLSILIVFASIPVFAAEQASDQIYRYSIDVYETNDGRIAIDFDVVGTDTMNRIGAESIAVYYRDGSRWIFLGENTRDNNGMSRANTSSFTNTIYFDGDSGYDYKIVVEVFAENNEGYDSRIKTYYISL